MAWPSALRPIDRGGDWNGDGKVTSPREPGRGRAEHPARDGTGHFASTQEIGVATTALRGGGDWNGDGRQDLATANFDTSAISILLTRAARDRRAGGQPRLRGRHRPAAVVLVDVDADGKPDSRRRTPAATRSPSCATRRRQLLEPRPRQDADTPVALAAGDFNGDGTPDS